MGALEELQAATQRVVTAAGPSVVGIGRHWGRGSGVVVAPGRVLTNAHNVRGETVTCVFADGRTATGNLAAVDLQGDLAVVRVDTDGAPAILWPEGASQLELGAPVFALAGLPGGGVRVTHGFVSSLERAFRGPRGRRIVGSIEHTAPLAPGSSGGPIVDAAGAFRGLNTNRLGDGFYLALPATDELRARVEALGRGEAPAHPRLGIAVAPARVARRLRRSVGLPERDGVLVRAVEEGSPAADAGLAEGDLIVEAGGKPVADVDDLHDALDSAAGASLELRIERAAAEVTVRVDFASAGGAG